MGDLAAGDAVTCLRDLDDSGGAGIEAMVIRLRLGVPPLQDRSEAPFLMLPRGSRVKFGDADA